MTQLWRIHLTVLAGCAVLLLGLFHRDAFDMARIWWSISTYSHCLFIPPIIGWLIWQRLDEIKRLSPRSWWPGLIGIATAAVIWALGEAGGISLFRHAALILMLQSITATILGPTIVRAILFPLFYLVFLIPLGEEAVPLLQTVTAKMCMFFLGIFGIEAHIEGVFITTPTGLFEVAEACSGVKFLVAMVAYSTLAANVCFLSWKRRFWFLAMAFIVPIIANGLRAFGTIYISYLTKSTKFAESFDHIIFGWVFFGVVMVIVMGLGWRWFDRKPDALWIGDVKPDDVKAPKLWHRAAAAVLLAYGIVAGQSALAALGRSPIDQPVSVPQVNGWTRAPISQSYPWIPRFDGSDHQLWVQFVNQKGDRVDLNIALFAWQGEGREMVGFGQGAFDPRTKWSWANSTAAPAGGKADRIFAPGAEREVASFYWIGNQLTGSATRVKFETLKARLLGQDQVSAAILISAEDSKAHRSRAAIDTFLHDMGPVDAVARQLVNEARGKR